ncbi:MAG: acetylxylan esterase, partial [Candidatus Hydrogenedentes bacterium]|nr:acetylxylan esterase [Candidatus Hydrogenedentota bacterium]
MRRIHLALFILATVVMPSITFGAEFPPVAELPERVAPPDPLVMLDGSRVDSVEMWESKRRPELKALFQHYVYGYSPPPTPIAAVIEQEDSDLFGGKATLRQVVISFPALPENAPRIHLALFLPNSKTPAPVFLALNKCGNYTVTDDPRVRFDSDAVRHSECPPADSRGSEKDFWCIEYLIGRGYAFATFHESNMDPDINDFTDGIHPFFKDLPGPAEAHWGTIAAWAWGLQRCVDYL